MTKYILVLCLILSASPAFAASTYVPFASCSQPNEPSTLHFQAERLDSGVPTHGLMSAVYPNSQHGAPYIYSIDTEIAVDVATKSVKVTFAAGTLTDLPQTVVIQHGKNTPMKFANGDEWTCTSIE